MGGWGGGLDITRQRYHSETDKTYNPDLEYSQQGYADALYGKGAPIGSYGMTGGQYPTVGKDRPGFGSNTYDNPFDFHSRPGGDSGSAEANANYIKFGGGQPGALPPGGGTGIYPGGGSRPGYGSPQSGSGPNGYDSPSGQAGGGGGGGYQFGGGGGGYGTGSYGAMQPYQFGSGGAAGDTTATGAAAYQGYGQLGRAYGRLGSQGVTGQERANLMSASNEAIQSNANAYRDQIMNRAGASGNYAGTAGALARLGASSGQNLVSADRQNQIAIMQENQRRKEAGLAGQAGVAAGQAGLYGTTAGYTQGLMSGRARLASLDNRDRVEGTGTGGKGGINYGGGGGGGG